jgi:hypothetical protein
MVERAKRTNRFVSLIFPLLAAVLADIFHPLGFSQ